MSKHFLLAYLVYLSFSINIAARAQTRLTDSLPIDSTTFMATRNKLNALPNAAFEKHTFINGKSELPYRLLLPQNYQRGKKYPLVIALHNSSRIGNDNEQQLEPLAKIWLRPEIYGHYPAILLVPQFNSRSSNYEMDAAGILTAKPSSDVMLVLELIRESIQKYTVDPSQIYLVGYSMGGSTAQNLMSLSPKTFAAIVAIAAVPDLSNLKGWHKKRIYLIHGARDTENPYAGTKLLYAKLGKNKKLVFKTYTQLNHQNINIPLLLSEEIPQWLFNQTK